MTDTRLFRRTSDSKILALVFVPLMIFFVILFMVYEIFNPSINFIGSVVLASIPTILCLILISRSINHYLIVNDESIELTSASGKTLKKISLKSLTKIEYLLTDGSGSQLLFEDNEKNKLCIPIFSKNIYTNQEVLFELCKSIAKDNLKVTSLLAQEKLGIKLGNEESRKLSRIDIKDIAKKVSIMLLFALILSLILAFTGLIK